MNPQNIQKKYFDDIQEMKRYLKIQTTSEKYRQGVQCFKEGKILDFHLGNRDRIVTAFAEGSQGNYYHITLDLERLTGRCSCPSDHYQEKCKHVVAMVYALSDLTYRPSEKSVAGYQALENELQNIRESKAKAGSIQQSPADHIDSAATATSVSSKEMNEADNDAADLQDKVVKKAPYPQYIDNILRACSPQEQLALLEHLLATQKANHAAARVWWQARHIDLKEMAKFIQKQKKVFETDFFGRKTDTALKEIKTYFAQILEHLMKASEAPEKTFYHRVDILRLLEVELFNDGHYFEEVFKIQQQLTTQIFSWLERDPKRIRPLMERALREDQHHILWKKLVRHGGVIAKEILLAQISLSNSRIPPLFDSSEAYQMLIINALVSPRDGIADNAFFEKVMKECDLIADPLKENFYRIYYKNMDQMEKYLENNTLLSQDRLDLTELYYLLEIEAWEKADALVEKVLTDPQYLGRLRFQFSFMDAVLLKRDLILQFKKYASEEDRHKDFEKLYQQVEKLDLKEDEKACFFWEERQYSKIIPYIRWYRDQSLISNNYQFKSSDHKNNVLFYLRGALPIENNDIDELFKAALSHEIHYLENTQSNVYDFAYELVALVFARGLHQELREFVQYCQTHFARRKKLIEELTLWIDKCSSPNK